MEKTYKPMTDGKLGAIKKRADNHINEVDLLIEEIKKLREELAIAKWKTRQVELNKNRTIARLRKERR